MSAEHESTVCRPDNYDILAHPVSLVGAYRSMNTMAALLIWHSLGRLCTNVHHVFHTLHSTVGKANPGTPIATDTLELAKYPWGRFLYFPVICIMIWPK
jgi:hypothetical protein